MVGHPTDREILGMVRANMITNCPATESAVHNANRIFVPDLAGVRGRMVRRAPEVVWTGDYISVPPAVVERFRYMTIAADIMFVNGVPFLVTVGRGLNLITSEYTPVRTAKHLCAGIEHVIELYKHGGYTVGTVLMDNEFESLKELIPGIVINTTTEKEHVPEIE